MPFIAAKEFREMSISDILTSLENALQVLRDRQLHREEIYRLLCFLQSGVMSVIQANLLPILMKSK